MARELLAPTGSEKQVDVRLDGGVTRRYSGRDGIYSVVDSDVAALKSEGFTEKSLSGTTRSGDGFRCEACGFGSWFRTCSRCGGACKKENEHE